MFWKMMRKVYKDPPASPQEVEEAYEWHEWRARMERFYMQFTKMSYGDERQEYAEQYARNNRAMYNIEPQMWKCVTRDWSYDQRTCEVGAKEEEPW